MKANPSENISTSVNGLLLGSTLLTLAASNRMFYVRAFGDGILFLLSQLKQLLPISPSISVVYTLLS